MRILIVSHLFKNPLEHSKLPNLFDLVQRLCKVAEVEVVAPVPWAPALGSLEGWYRLSQIPGEHRYGSVRVRYPRHLVLPRRILYVLAGWTFLRALRRTVRGEPYDVIWAHYAFPDGWAVVRFGEKAGTPIFVTVRGDDVRTDVRHFGVERRVRETLARADVVTSPHPETTKLAYALGARRVVELHNGVDVARYARGDPGRVRTELGLKDEFVVTFVGHLVEFKDPRTFVEAAAHIPASEPMVFLVVGSPGRGRAQTDLRDLVRRLGVENRVRFLGDRGDVPDILAASHVFVALSPVENIWSNTILEAMAAGVPCIVTRAGTTEQYLRDGDQAVLIPRRDPRALATALRRLRDDSRLRGRLADSGRRLVAAEFDLEAIAQSALALCESWAGKRHGGGPDDAGSSGMADHQRGSR